MALRVIVCLIYFFSSISCSLIEFAEISPDEETLWKQAQNHIKGGRFNDAIEPLEEIDKRFPFGKYSSKAQLDLIYVYFKSSKYELARVTADRFIRLNPASNKKDYAMYMKGLSNFSNNRSYVARFLPGDETGRDLGQTSKTIRDFLTLIQSHPDSSFSDDAKLRLIYIRNQLAEYELNVARYYIRKKAYVAAANRALFAVENFPSAPSVAEALIIMHLSYAKLGLTEKARNTIAILAINFPDFVEQENDELLLRKNLLKNNDPNWIKKITVDLFVQEDQLADKLNRFNQKQRTEKRLLTIKNKKANQKQHQDTRSIVFF